MNLKPLYDKIVLEIADKQELTSATGLTYVKDMSISNNTTMVGKVVAVGEGRLMQNGEIIPLRVKIGDMVVYPKIQGENYTDGKAEYTILSESVITAILVEE